MDKQEDFEREPQQQEPNQPPIDGPGRPDPPAPGDESEDLGDTSQGMPGEREDRG